MAQLCSRQGAPYSPDEALDPMARLRPPARFLAYGLAGWAIDSLYVFVHTGRRRPSHLVNVPIYGLAQPLFEPLHDRLRDRPVAVRAAAYGAGILVVEYASGRVVRRLLGHVPWDYGGARFAVDGLVRLDYFPLWAAFGLGLERLHDLLVAPRHVRCGHLSSSQPSAIEGTARD
jgi:hypothetical protein